MKRSTTIFAAALIAAATFAISCNEVDPVTPGPTPTEDEKYLDGSIDDYQTKTVLTISDNRGKTSWELGDQFKACNSTSSELFSYAFPKGSDPAIGRFFAPDASSFDVTSAAIAYYPGDKATIDYSTKTITAVVPATQAYVDGSFGPGAAPMVSNVYSDKMFKFRNVFGGVIIPLYDAVGSTVTSIEVSTSETAPLGTVLTGNDFKFVLGTGNTFSITAATTNPGRKITMTPNVTLGTDAESAKRFCFMMPGLASAEKVTVKITTTSHVYTRSFTANKSTDPKNLVEANRILILNALNLGDEISFNASVAGWNRDGEVVTLSLK